MLFKRTLKIILPILGITAAASAQQTGVSPFVFPQFVKGTVLQKGGGVVEAMLDYNTITQELMFDKDGAKLVLDQVDNIDTVYLEKRRFVPARQMFLEKLTNTPISLYIQYKSTAINDKASIGASESNTAIGGFVGVKQVKGSAKADNYALQLPAGYSLKTANVFWLEHQGQYNMANDLKKVIKAFPGKEAQINAFVKDNNISFNKTEDMVKLIEFCNK